MAQNYGQVNQLCTTLEAAAKGSKSRQGGKKTFSCRKATFDVAGTDGITVDSWRFQDWDYKRDDLPTYARGLFTTRRRDGKHEIVIRGYDKFFNVGETRQTEWRNVETDTIGPYELSVKENGCIIFMSGLEDGTLLVCSKHSTGVRTDVDESHAMVGERWVKKHLESVGKTTKDLAMELRRLNVTAVGELCDDEFEEHVLEYPPDQAGLYLHGMNRNLPEFATFSGSQVHEFADKWGFKKAQYVTIQSLEEVKEFLDKCAETGSWAGRDTEGFVIRCKIRDAHGQAGVDWFFKYKFEEPYLMYRQWRECTKAVIAGRQPKYKKHKKITEAYLMYARRQIHQDKNIAKDYNKNHGIIKMRDGFLASVGKKGSDIIQEEQAGGDATSDAVTGNLVLVPIATIGCGKTTVAMALVKLFDFGHLQNDNIEGKKDRPKRFAHAVVNAMAAHKVVIADRNNHQRREREQIMHDVEETVPTARFVALHYVHEPKGKLLNGIRKVTRERVLERGDNHQTIRAGSKSENEIIEIMEGFLQRFQGCNTEMAPDNNFDDVINLDVEESSLHNLETVITHLYHEYPGIMPGEMPSLDDMQEAIDFAMNDEVKLKHDLSFNKNDKQEKRQPQSNGQHATNGSEGKKMTVDQLVRKLDYFGVSISSTQVTSLLSSMFTNASAEEARMYNQLKKTRRLQDEFHVTLMHRANAQSDSDLWQFYVNGFVDAKPDPLDDKKATPSLGASRIRLERLIWDDRIMTFVVRILPNDDGHTWQTSNATAHITVGTASQDIKPKESNDLLAQWMGGTRSDIHDMQVPGMKVIDGAVKPVLQRGSLK